MEDFKDYIKDQADSLSDELTREELEQMCQHILDFAEDNYII